MSDRGGRHGQRAQWASDHERARHRAAERLSLPLPANESAWLDRHLDQCPACASVAADYAAQQVALRGLPEPVPPRDLWARTATALDREERRARQRAGSADPFGRGRSPGFTGFPSGGRRSDGFGPGWRPMALGAPGGRRHEATMPGLSWVAPFGAVAALAVVIVVAGSSLLAGGPAGPARGSAPGSTLTAQGPSGALPTPIQVGAGDVAWLTLADDGSYSLNFANVDQVCPANAQPDCGPIAQSSPRQLPNVRTTLHTVLRDPSHKHLVVVTAGTKKRSGGSLIVLTVPTDTLLAGTAPSATTAGASATPVPVSTGSGPSAASSSPAVSGTASPITSLVTALPSPSAAPTATASVPPSAGQPTPGRTAAPSVPVATAFASVGPSATGPAPTPAMTGVPPVSATTAPSSPSGLTGSALPATAPASPDASAQPVATPSGPQPSATAVAIINDIVLVGETAAYSPDGTMLAFSARPADGSHGPDIYLWRIGDPSAQPMTTDHASVFSGWLSNQLLGSRAVDATGQPADTAPPASPTATPVPLLPGVFGRDPFAAPFLFPSSPAAAAPATPRVVGPAGPTPAPSDVRGAPSAGQAQPRSFILDPQTGVATDLPGPIWRPVVDPSGRFAAYWAGTLRYDPSTLTWLPDTGALVLAAWPGLREPVDGASAAPQPLLTSSDALAPTGEWDSRWDESGSHIAIWVADAGNAEVGRLTLLTIDSSGQIDPEGVSLHDTPALAGFSMGSDRLAWATPPAPDGDGSRLQVLAWSGANAGQIDGQPVPGSDSVVVVR